jgi:hypothetical protein
MCLVLGTRQAQVLILHDSWEETGKKYLKVNEYIMATACVTTLFFIS